MKHQPRKYKKLKDRGITFKEQFLKVIHAAGREAQNRGMKKMGFIVGAEEGWVVKQFADGKKEKIKKIEEVSIPSQKAIITAILKDGEIITLVN
jgi:hypothetical protein